MEKTEEAVPAVDELLRDPDREAFWDSLKNDPDKRRRFNTGWLNIVNTNWGRTQDKKFRLELEELKQKSQMDRSRSPQGHAC